MLLVTWRCRCNSHSVLELFWSLLTPEKHFCLFATLCSPASHSLCLLCRAQQIQGRTVEVQRQKTTTVCKVINAIKLCWANRVCTVGWKPLSYTNIQAPSWAWCKAAPGTAQVSFLVSDRCSCHFHAQRPRCVHSKYARAHLCAHGGVGLQMRCVDAHCYLEAGEKEPGLKSMMQHFSWYI